MYQGSWFYFNRKSGEGEGNKIKEGIWGNNSWDFNINFNSKKNFNSEKNEEQSEAFVQKTNL